MLVVRSLSLKNKTKNAPITESAVSLFGSKSLSTSPFILHVSKRFGIVDETLDLCMAEQLELFYRPCSSPPPGRTASESSS